MPPSKAGLQTTENVLDSFGAHIITPIKKRKLTKIPASYGLQTVTQSLEFFVMKKLLFSGYVIILVGTKLVK